ncbi:hypothetical protein [Flavobacterium covae]|uniref:hypothetical protein n=1 Tax=Flavobacterium covae TaxID=2906076 RepID=UPI0035E40EBD
MNARLDNGEVNQKVQSIRHGAKNNFDNFIIEQYKFEDIKFEYIGLRNTIFDRCIFLNVIFETVYLDNSSFKNCIFKDSTFQAIDFGLSNVIFDNSIFCNVNFYKTDSLTCSYNAVSFINCNFAYFDISGNLFKDCRVIDCNVDGLIYSPEAFSSDNNLCIPDIKKAV